MSKSLLKIIQIYIFIYVFLFAARPINDADFWFHLKTGQYVFSTHSVPRNELFSFTYRGIPWVAHGWLSGVFFYSVWTTVGPKFLIFVFALLTVVAFWIAFKRANSHPLFAGLAVLIGVWTAIPNLGVRPRVFSILFVSIFLAFLHGFTKGIRERWIWLLIPMLALWANLHGGFLLGLALIALTAVGMVLDRAVGVLEQPDLFLPRLKKLALLFVGCGLAGLVNPYGIGLYTKPIAVLRSPIFQDLVTDWMSPNFHLASNRPLLLLIIMTIGVLALSPKRPKPGELLLFLTMLYATLKTQRNAVFFALVSVPLFATFCQSWFESTSFGRTFGVARAHSDSRLAVLLSVGFFLPIILFAGRLKATFYSNPTQESLEVPVRAVEYLKQNGLTGNTLTVPNVWGAYVFWAAPNNPVYIDGRDVYPDAFVKEYVDVYQGRLDWHPSFAKHNVQLVLIEPDRVLARELAESSEWEKIYQDNMSLVFKRR